MVGVQCMCNCMCVQQMSCHKKELQASVSNTCAFNGAMFTAVGGCVRPGILIFCGLPMVAFDNKQGWCFLFGCLCIAECDVCLSCEYVSSHLVERTLALGFRDAAQSPQGLHLQVWGNRCRVPASIHQHIGLWLSCCTVILDAAGSDVLDKAEQAQAGLWWGGQGMCSRREECSARAPRKDMLRY